MPYHRTLHTQPLATMHAPLNERSLCAHLDVRFRPCTYAPMHAYIHAPILPCSRTSIYPYIDLPMHPRSFTPMHPSLHVRTPRVPIPRVTVRCSSPSPFPYHVSIVNSSAGTPTITKGQRQPIISPRNPATPYPSPAPAPIAVWMSADISVRWFSPKRSPSREYISGYAPPSDIPLKGVGRKYEWPPVAMTWL